MAMNQAIETYRQTNNSYAEGLESPHGRVKILIETVLTGLDKMIEKHPKTEFVALGKCLNAITVLAESLNLKDGGELAQNLLELYDYCKRCLSVYLDTKDVKKLEEVHSIFTSLIEGWEGIDPKKSNKV